MLWKYGCYIYLYIYSTLTMILNHIFNVHDWNLHENSHGKNKGYSLAVNPHIIADYDDFPAPETPVKNIKFL